MALKTSFHEAFIQERLRFSFAKYGSPNRRVYLYVLTRKREIIRPGRGQKRSENYQNTLRGPALMADTTNGIPHRKLHCGMHWRLSFCDRTDKPATAVNEWVHISFRTTLA